MPSVHAYCGLHYGKEYFEWAIASVLPFVDLYHVFYSQWPSHGGSTRMTIPQGENRETLKYVADSFGTDVVWHDCPRFRHEGEHRTFALNTMFQSYGADLAVWNDADECWDADILCNAMDKAIAGQAREYRVHARHLWKGFNWICDDAAMPVRFVKPTGTGEAYLNDAYFWHFGYAQSAVLVAYKLKIHGHRADIDPNWWKRVYVDWKPEGSFPQGVHPTNGVDAQTGKPFWTPKPFDKRYIERLVGDHPYWDEEFV